MALKLRNKAVQSMITVAEYKKLVAAAHKANLTVSDWLRLRIQMGIDERIKT